MNRESTLQVSEANEPQLYIERGFIEVEDDVAFKRIYEACNCFGHNYKGFYKGGTKHPYRDDVTLWFPKLYSNGKWINSISLDESTIIERPENPEEVKEHMNYHIEKGLNRIVFAHQKDSEGRLMYRFKGEYKIDVQQSREENCLVWKRISSRVEIFPQKLKL